MSETNSNGNGRVTNAQLRDAVDSAKELITAQQKVEHVKTRGIVILMGGLTGGAKIAAMLGFLHIPSF